MKTTAVSGDMMVKLALGVAVLGIGYFAFIKVKKTAGAAAAAAVDAVNPASSNNLVNRGVTAVGSAISGDSGWTLGGWIYDITHDDPMKATSPTPVYGSTALNAAAAADARREFAATDPRRLDLQQSTYDPMVSDSGMDYRYF